MLQDRADKICEMANVMQKSIQIDEENMAKEQELMARLITENKVSPVEVFHLLKDSCVDWTSESFIHLFRMEFSLGYKLSRAPFG